MNISLLTRKTTLLGLLTAGLLASCTTPAVVPPGTPSVVASGFNGPQGLLVLPDGSLLVSDDGTGGTTPFTGPGRDGSPLPGSYGDTARVVRVAADGTVKVVTQLLSVSPPLIEATGGGRIVQLGGDVYVTDGIWNAGYSVPRPDRASSVLRLNSPTSAGAATTEVANLFAFEAANNPDGVPAAQGGLDSHAYGLAAGPGGQLYVADAGGNDLLKVDPATGTVSLVASLAGQTSTGQQSVPTNVAVGADGALYVSLLTGYPFPNGGAKVVKVVGKTVSTFASGLSLLTDIQTGPDGQLYALSFGKSDTSLTPPYVPNSGSVIRLKANGTQEVVLDGLNFPSVLAFNTSGDAFISKNGLGAPGSGQILKYPKLTTYAAK